MQAIYKEKFFKNENVLKSKWKLDLNLLISSVQNFNSQQLFYHYNFFSNFINFMKYEGSDAGCVKPRALKRHIWTPRMWEAQNKWVFHKER